jgi:hypothetical protein
MVRGCPQHFLIFGVRVPVPFWCASSGALKHFLDKPLSSSPDRTLHLH